MENKFNFADYLAMVDLMSQLRDSSVPKNPEVDGIAIDLMWCELNTLLMKMGSHFKEQLVTKEYIEKFIGREVQSLEKVYDENGILTGVNVVPVPVVEFIEVKFTITPEGIKYEN